MPVHSTYKPPEQQQDPSAQYLAHSNAQVRTRVLLLPFASAQQPQQEEL
jgi:hypothetical protein